MENQNPESGIRMLPTFSEDIAKLLRELEKASGVDSNKFTLSADVRFNLGKLYALSTKTPPNIITEPRTASFLNLETLFKASFQDLVNKIQKAQSTIIETALIYQPAIVRERDEPYDGPKSENIAAQQDMRLIREEVTKINENLRKIDPSNLSVGTIIAFIGVILSILVSIKDLNSNAISPKELENFQKEMQDSIRSILREFGEPYMVSRACSVLMLPKHHTLRITVLNKGEEVTILQRKHEWVFISSRDTIQGWVPKKYLMRSK